MAQPAKEVLAAALRSLHGTRCVELRTDGPILEVGFEHAKLRVVSARRLECDEGLVGARLLEATVLGPALDLALRFDHGRLLVFADARSTTCGGNWRLTHRVGAWACEPEGFVAMLDEEGVRMTDREKAIEALEEALGALQGRRVWAAFVTGPHGNLQLGFGKRFERPFAIDNPSLPPAFQTHFPEFGLFVECAWRLDTASKVVASARDALVLDGRVGEALGRLDDVQVEGAAFSGPAGDLAIRFRSDDLVLHVFADRSRPDRREENYTLFLPKERFTVGGGGVVHHEREAGAPPPPLRVVK